MPQLRCAYIKEESNKQIEKTIVLIVPGFAAMHRLLEYGIFQEGWNYSIRNCKSHSQESEVKDSVKFEGIFGRIRRK